MTGLYVGRDALPRNAQTLIPLGDYKSVLPAPVTIPTLGATGLILVAHVTAVVGAVTGMFVSVNGIALGNSGSFVAGADTVLVFDPRVKAVVNGTIKLPLPAEVTVAVATVLGTPSALTFSVGAALVL